MPTSQALNNVKLTSLKGVGPALALKLNELGIHNVQDLLFHLPSRYEDRTRILSIRSLKVGQLAQIQGEVVKCAVQFGKRRSLHCTITDKTGFIGLRFFHFSAAQKNALAAGCVVRCFGEVRYGRHGFELYHPEYKILKDPINEPIADTLTPVYPASEGLQQTRLRSIISQARELLQRCSIDDYLPLDLRQRFGFAPLEEVLNLIHQPSIDSSSQWLLQESNPGHKRLAFEELLSHRLCMRLSRVTSNQKLAPQLQLNGQLSHDFLELLPFTLTKGQQLASLDINNDMTTSRPMLRLLQGDVGSGKTVVAALSALNAINNGYQVAIMAPTEILAEQHFRNFQQWFNALGLNVGWLSGKIKAAARRKQLAELSSGETQLLVGTHALFQEGVIYSRLGLIIIDEQHRFGVHQRLALREKAAKDEITPHQLVMTATPIPRTLAMSAYADLDCSVINELPPGRIPINTALISNDRRDQVVERIEKACSAGNQAYWVCTLIEESEELECQAAEVTCQQLREQLPHLVIGLIHGRLKPAEKVAIMDSFKNAEIHLLVATTVIEVGVDVPNANLMVIENPERLGLAQLHQLRGRVGRGLVASHCIMLYQTPLSEHSKKRLIVMRESTDGFYIAEKDLELRGPGQVLGTQQTGMMSFKIADLSVDADLLDDVQAASEIIMSEHPEIIEPLIQRWLGGSEHYINV
ncbi:MAG TPA: ATP-dependent DNA helicase RecG [Gammaproteobacteria bacterium]|nr:ATP-dependent DNA helicase RecG [Gammaproteobacteria bacterium]